METFPSKYFSFSVRYPESGTRIELGNSYQYDAAPNAPDQRIFTLNLQGMCYFVDQSNQIDVNYEAGRNLGKLEAFYQDHKRATSFYLDHPVYGQVVCKFLNPLQIPEGNAGGGGTVPPFQVELIEQP